MATDKQKEDFKKYVKTVLGPRASMLKPYEGSKKNPRLLHISTDGKIKKFIPSISKRTAKGEDRSIPRISTAPHILGCINGYAEYIVDFTDKWSCDWKGGYYIYDIPYALAGTPDVELVIDVEKTDEKWVIPFDGRHREVEAPIIGKLFMKSLHIEGTGNERTWSLVCYLENKSDTPIFLAGDTPLEKGYWRFQISYSDSKFQFPLDDFSFSKVDRKEFMEAKGATAGLLSYSAPVPSDSW